MRLSAIVRRAAAKPSEQPLLPQARPSATVPDTRLIGSVRRAAVLVLALLLAQYALGMYVNLFASIPLAHPGHAPHDFVTGTAGSLGWVLTSQHAPFLLATHASVGLLLALGGGELVRRAVRTGDRVITIASALGLLCILAAGLSGATFLDYNRNGYSYAMSLLFAAVFACDGVVLMIGQRRAG
jgi:hypothetical protein